MALLANGNNLSIILPIQAAMDWLEYEEYTSHPTKITLVLEENWSRYNPPRAMPGTSPPGPVRSVWVLSDCLGRKTAWSIQPGEAYLMRDGIRNIKSVRINQIFKQEMLHTYEQKSWSRDELVREAHRAIRRLTQEMARSILYSSRD